ncbi:MAG TPA: TerB family tellurite resistance protein [Polyangiaceae bacterium]|nr:TerB family tellurite resistance protein [Polyangiaceae bacterium]
MVLDNRRIRQLRDRLLQRGPASAIPGAFSMADPPAAAAYDRIQPFAEAMFLVMSADAEIKDTERDVLRGALRTLSEGGLGTAATDAMLNDLEERLARDGMDVRLDNVAAHLWPDPVDRELALALAAATAKADGTIDPAERSAIFGLAARLGVPAARVAGWLEASDEDPDLFDARPLRSQR